MPSDLYHLVGDIDFGRPKTTFIYTNIHSVPKAKRKNGYFPVGWSRMVDDSAYTDWICFGKFSKVSAFPHFQKKNHHQYFCRFLSIAVLFSSYPVH